MLNAGRQWEFRDGVVPVVRHCRVWPHDRLERDMQGPEPCDAFSMVSYRPPHGAIEAVAFPFPAGKVEVVHPGHQPWTLKSLRYLSLMYERFLGYVHLSLCDRGDLESYISSVLVDELSMPNVRELPPRAGLSYVAFIDPAGGQGRDSFCAAVAHQEEREGKVVAVLDAVFEARPPFDVSAVVGEVAEFLKRYDVTSAQSDAYGAGSPPACSPSTASW
jgi:hypothetical protein